MSFLHVFNAWWLRFHKHHADGIINFLLSMEIDKEATIFIGEDFENISKGK